MATNTDEMVAADAQTVAKSAEINYRCAICGETRDDIGSLKRHITNKDDADHAGKTPSSDPHLVEYVGESEEVLTRLNERSDARGAVSDNHFKLLWKIYNDPSASRTELARELSVSTSTIDNWLADLGLVGGKATNPEDREERAASILADAGVEFVDPDADGPGDGDVYEPFPDPEDMTVRSLEMGDTKANTEVGGWYEGRVNNVEPYGVFVTLARSVTGNYKEDYTGLAHKRVIPAMYTPRDYEQGDTVVVERLPDEEDMGNGENGRTPLRMCTDPDGDWIVDGPMTPVGATSEDVEDSEGDTAPDDSNASTGRVRRESGNASYDGPETGIDLTEQYVNERPVQDDGEDAGDGEAPALVTSVARIQDRVNEIAEVVGDGDDPEPFDHVHRRFDVTQDALGISDGGPDAGKLDSIIDQLDALEAAVTARDSAPADTDYTLHLTREEMKTLVREAPEDVSDKALDALAGGR